MALAKENGANVGEAASPTVKPPAVVLPKGGGAIRGIGEKFAANPVTGTGSLTVPIVTSPGRSGFGPQLSLSYDSGSGNSSFGFGWSLSIPSITRKTDKGLPQYRDSEESDVFILSGAEDLVPTLIKTGGNWVPEAIPPRTLQGKTFHIQRYRPRIEGLFARIERWTNLLTGESHWRSITRDNLTTLYGKDNSSRIFDPALPTRIFSWLICESYDDKGNHIVYDYKTEDSLGVDHAQVHEKNRTQSSRAANRYLKRIKYGNKVSRLAPPDPARSGWMFEVVFDYGEGHYAEELPDVDGNVFARADAESPAGLLWPTRPDPFSSYRAGFEIRTYRLCQRVLMFHHFAAELGTNDYLVRSTDFIYDSNPTASFITSVIQSGYRLDNGQYLKKSLPPLEFSYSQIPTAEQLAGQSIQAIDAQSLENLPQGLDNAAYQWVDLDGEGLSGILTEQANAWFYKRNLGEGNFGPLERVATKPSLAALSTGRQQLLDLAGDGQIDLVSFSGPTPGFYERTQDEDWEHHKAFKQLPNIAWDDPNLRFVDLNGDGYADILLTEGDVFSWYPSLAEEGFDQVEHVAQSRDEERGPKLVFSDGTQSIYLADMSGDGLTDLVRIRNGEVCYWPNLGYGRFGARVSMDNAPWFDHPDQFDQRRIRLADIDGSGVIDILYVNNGGVRFFYNQSGNRWSEEHRLPQFPHTDNLISVQALDLLGNGTACLVWSSPLPHDARQPLLYIDLMNGKKPHLLVETNNNLGAKTKIEYAPSTKSYLADKIAGKPWITKLPFPVHCVEKVIVTDKWRKTTFSTTYSYHHGYFDGGEREFRGFGRVEQLDTESYGIFASGNSDSPYVTPNKTLYQPPVKTVTWYHTGAFFDREHILSAFADEYFPNWFEADNPDQTNVLGSFRENDLPEPDLDGDELSAEEWREALRACKGMALRQEIYELDVDQLDAKDSKQIPVRLFSTAYHNCHIRRLQPLAENRHAVFLVVESEAITYNYELDLRQSSLTPDPRIAHTLNLSFNEYGQVQQSVAVVYPRLGQYTDSALNTAVLNQIRAVQNELHIAYNETRYTGDIDDQDNRRLRLPCEVLTYELTGISPRDLDDRLTTDPRDDLYFTVDELRRYRLSNVYQTSGELVKDIAYHKLPNGTISEKRIIEHVRMLFFDENLTDPLAFRTLNRFGMSYETYKLALTEDLLVDVFGNKLTTDVRANLTDSSTSGYLSGANLTTRFATVPVTELAGQYWIRSGIAGFATDAAQHFYLPERYEDPFGNITALTFDGKYDLFIRSSTDSLGNTVTVEEFDYRVLAPQEMKDPNDNYSAVVFDTLGLPVGSALMGKRPNNVQTESGDNLVGFQTDLNPAEVIAFFTGSYDESRARSWLGDATARFVYSYGEQSVNGVLTYVQHPACACGILREKHVAQLAASSPIRTAFEYSDGMGTVLVKKIQAEPAPGETDLRWIASGKTILNNKGKPVKQYEPYFSTNEHRFEETQKVGVTPVMYYDAAGRLVRTELPDGTNSRVEFSPWHVRTFDANDTVLESKWYTDRGAPDPGQPLAVDLSGRLTATPEFRAAWLAVHHANTPALTILDSLGRDVIIIAHNRTPDANGQWQDERYLTFTKLDAEGKPLWIRDARKNLVMQYITPIKSTRAIDEPDQSKIEGIPANSVPCYDIAGNLLFQHSMDAGDRWTLMDAAGKPLLAWDRNERQTGAVLTLEDRFFFTKYDQLHRPVEQWLSTDGGAPKMIEHFEYRDVTNSNGTPNPQLAAHQAANLIGQLVLHYDASGLVETARRDFKGNVQVVRRTLVEDATVSLVDWKTLVNPDGSSKLSTEVFSQITEFDAFSRMTLHYNWHRAAPDHRVAVYKPAYNERGLLLSETLTVRARKTAGGFDSVVDTKTSDAIKEILYNVKGQKEFLKLGNGTLTHYDYDKKTFRLQQLRTTRLATGQVDPAFPDFASNLTDARVVQQLHYTCDPVGNITEIYDEAYKPAFFQNAIIEPQSLYEYDALYRLIRATGREDGAATATPPQIETKPRDFSFPIPDSNALRKYTQTYLYDSVGNIKQMSHAAGAIGSWTRDYTYATDSNSLLSTQQGNESTHYDYDTHGSMLNLANVPDEYRMQWDHRDMIGAINLGGGGQAYYQYDDGKQRTCKHIERNGSGIEDRIYLGAYELYRRTVAGAVVEEIESHHLFEGEQRILLVDDVLKTNRAHADGTSFKTDSILRYQYSNHLGSACLELDDQAEIISYEEYHPYGTSAYRAMKSGIEAPPKRYRYTGMERDEESGLSYHSARYYSPWLARWVSADPSGLADGVNRFLYCHSNPITNFDKNGSQTENYEFGKKIERIFEQINESIGEGRKSAGKDPTVTMRTQKAYNKGNSFLDFEFRSFLDDHFLKSVDTKGLHLANYMDKKGKVDYVKLTTKFEENMQQSIKHVTDATVGNKLQNKSASETILYVLATTEAQRKKFPKQITDVEIFLKVQGAAAREGSGPRVGVGVVRFEELYERVKASGKKPGKPSKVASKAKIALVLAAVLTSTYAQAAEPGPDSNEKPAPGSAPGSKDAAKPSGELIARKAVLDQVIATGPVEFQIMNEGAKKNEAAVFNFWDWLKSLWTTSTENLGGNTGNEASGSKSSTTPSATEIEKKFGKQSPPGGIYQGKY